MTKNELKSLSRAELIDIIYQLRVENSELEEKLDQASALLEKKALTMKNAGSIAEAALSLNGVFDAAQKAADQYLYSVKAAYSGLEGQMQAAKQQCRQMLSEASAEAAEIRSGAEKESRERLAAAERECKRKYDQFLARVDQYLKEYPELRAAVLKRQGQN